MIRRAGWLPVLLALCLAVRVSAQTTIFWNSTANATNLTSTGSIMDGGFRFEIGVFTGSFDPATRPLAEWAANWNGSRWDPDQRTSYDASTRKFAASVTRDDNVSPFTVGKPAYVWGFKGDSASGEWILFRASNWTWPSANPFIPAFVNWFAKDATPIIGSINSSGSPFLMKSAAVTNAAPPSTSYAQWQADELAGETLNGPNDDPDKDGLPNLLEFVFGTAPKRPGAPVATPVTLVGGHLRITVPRRIDRTATLTVEVSSDLKTWNSGASYTQVVSNGLTSLVVDDLTTLDAAHPKRFMRLRATQP
jgi:hypothetical protein